MTTAVIAIVLCAAVLHASRNALLKGGGDRFLSMVVRPRGFSFSRAFPCPLIYWIMRGWRTPLLYARAETAKAAAGGLFSLLAYGMVIWAASVGPMGSV